MSKKFSEQYSPEYYLTQEELLENLDRNYVHRDGIHTISDSFAHNQIKEIVGNAYTIPTTSEREAELEKIITKMQEELDKRTVTREWILNFVTDFNRARYQYDEETALASADTKLEKLGVEVVE